MRVCSICDKPTKDTCSYVIKSTEEPHTYWSLDMCIKCRDEIFMFIDTKRKKIWVNKELYGKE